MNDLTIQAIENAINALEKHRAEAHITCEETCLCWELASLINILIEEGEE